MRRLIIPLLLCGSICGLTLNGCGETAKPINTPDNMSSAVKWQDLNVGRIGDDVKISRAQAAKMMALAFYTKEELAKLPLKQNFADVSAESWYAPYVNGAVESGFLAGDDTGFHPDEPLTLQQTQILLEKLHPNHKTKINVTEESKDKAVSYSLWMQIFEDALKQRRGEDSLYSYGFKDENIVPLENTGTGSLLAEKGLYSALGMDMSPYFYKEVEILSKDGEIVALLAVKELSPTIQNIYYHTKDAVVVVETGKGAVNLSWAKEADSLLAEKELAGIGQVKLQEGKVSDITAVPNLGRLNIKLVDNSQIELDNKGKIPWAENAGVYEETKDGIRRRPVSRLVTGTNIADIYETDGKINGAVIKEKAEPMNMRVLLSNEKGYVHEGVVLSSDTGFRLSNGTTTKDYANGELLNVLENPEAMALFTTGRITATPNGESPIKIGSILKNGTNPSYFGNIEIEQVDGGYRLINELPLETYLRGVVPGEMPTSFGLEALKVQAVAARSYAYNQFYANMYGEQGAHVDDTTNTQMYVGAAGDPLSDRAIAETEGVCLTYGNKVVTANFYSSTGGYSADASEVWRGNGGKTFPGDGKPYLKSLAQGLTEDFGDLAVEENAEKFYKLKDFDSYDKESPYVRWQVSMNGNELTAVINRGAAMLFKGNTGVLEVETADGWQSNIAPPIFTFIKNIEVVKRGQGGIVMILEITGETGKIRIETENAIRRALNPAKVGEGADIITLLNDGSERRNMSLLPSGFFIIEESREDKDADGAISQVTLFGGGNGHGAGMSQYGARGMALQGFNYEEILAHYFKDAKAEKVIS